MAISYAKVVKNQYIFRQLTDLTREEFKKIVEKSGQNRKKRKNVTDTASERQQKAKEKLFRKKENNHQ